ncbi:hypothetical protein PoHVEF18_006531 [Penicillium ochrochloron]
MSDECDKIGPPWGDLAVEQYFITNWDHSSAETPDQQRKRLVAEFLDLKLIPAEWMTNCEGDPSLIPPREPSTEEIETILRPYRCEKLRWHADNIYTGELCPMLLRTHYSNDEDEKKRHDEMMEKWTNGEIFGDEAWWAVLDDADIFNFGSDWRRIYDILPEVSYPIEFGCITKDDHRDLAARKQSDPQAWRDDRDSVIESVGMTMQSSATTTYIFIADEETFESGRPRVIYLDGLRRIVREGRMDPERDDFGSIIGLRMTTYELLEYTTLDEKYRVNGEIGKELYQLTEEDLAEL